jgi:hypothetical protein
VLVGFAPDVEDAAAVNVKIDTVPPAVVATVVTAAVAVLDELTPAGTFCAGTTILGLAKLWSSGKLTFQIQSHLLALHPQLCPWHSGTVTLVLPLNGVTIVRVCKGVKDVIVTLGYWKVTKIGPVLPLRKVKVAKSAINSVPSI